MGNNPDFNLLFALDALLAEENVVAASRRLGISPSATSRSLSRLRVLLDDPILVRAGRRLVPSPRGEALRHEVADVVDLARRLLSRETPMPIDALEREFTIRASEGFAETFGPPLLARVGEEAPRVRLRFVLKADRDPDPLRNGEVDLETGVAGQGLGPELKTRKLFDDYFIGAVRSEHALAELTPTLEHYCGAAHVDTAWHASKNGSGPIDGPLAAIGAKRDVVAVVSGFSAALSLARATDMVASVPAHTTSGLLSGMHTFDLPFETSTITVKLVWHPRMDADDAHRWLRDCVTEVCRS
ncbi:MAG: LysR family transcriptional regulator [Myxococcota bacterium]